MAKTYLSPAAFEAMKSELKILLEEERPKVTAQVSAAAAMGDRSENADYLYGKKRLREIDRRVRFLQQKLADVEVIASEDASTSDVRFGSWVKIQNDSGEVRVLQVVGPDEMDSSGKKLTFTSALGQSHSWKKSRRRFSNPISPRTTGI
jgi:transcription elongation factor GreB